MTKNELIVKRKIHLLFAGGVLIVLAISTVTEILAGGGFLSAVWNAVREIRPMEYIMILLFWYVCAFHKPKDDWNGSFTTLNLRDTGK